MQTQRSREIFCKIVRTLAVEEWTEPFAVPRALYNYYLRFFVVIKYFLGKYVRHPCVRVRLRQPNGRGENACCDVTQRPIERPTELRFYRILISAWLSSPCGVWWRAGGGDDWRRRRWRPRRSTTDGRTEVVYGGQTGHTGERMVYRPLIKL